MFMSPSVYYVGVFACVYVQMFFSFLYLLLHRNGQTAAAKALIDSGGADPMKM